MHHASDGKLDMLQVDLVAEHKVRRLATVADKKRLRMKVEVELMISWWQIRSSGIYRTLTLTYSHLLEHQCCHSMTDEAATYT